MKRGSTRWWWIVQAARCRKIGYCETAQKCLEIAVMCGRKS